MGALALATLFTCTAVPASADATGDVRTAMIKLASLNSFRVTLPKTGTMDYVRPNAMHMTGNGREMYMFGSTMYMKPPGRKWMKMENPGGRNTPIVDWTRVTKDDAAKVSATDLGMRSVGGETLHAYRMTSKTGSRSTVYIARDGFVHRVEGDRPDSALTFSMFNAVAPFRPPM